jgi:hypothetical protein
MTNKVINGQTIKMGWGKADAFAAGILLYSVIK